MRTVLLCSLLTLLSGCWPTGEPEPEELPGEVERSVLFEIFSGSNCGPCLEADERISGIFLSNPDRYVALHYQIGSDPYVSGEGVARRMYYLPGADTYSIPWVQADGAVGFHPNGEGEQEPFSQELFDELAAIPATVDIQATYQVSGQSVDVELSVLPLQDYDEELALRVAILERTTFLNVGSNGQTEFHDVMKKMVPDEDGTPVESLVRGELQSFELSWTFQGDYAENTGMQNPVDHDVEHTVEDFDDLAVVVWLQDDESWEVLHAAAATSP